MTRMKVDDYDRLVDDIKEAIFWVFEDRGVNTADPDNLVELAVCGLVRGFVIVEE